jgi:hypothetical protein
MERIWEVGKHVIRQLVGKNVAGYMKSSIPNVSKQEEQRGFNEGCS